MQSCRFSPANVVRKNVVQPIQSQNQCSPGQCSPEDNVVQDNLVQKTMQSRTMQSRRQCSLGQCSPVEDRIVQKTMQSRQFSPKTNLVQDNVVQKTIQSRTMQSRRQFSPGQFSPEDNVVQANVVQANIVQVNVVLDKFSALFRAKQEIFCTKFLHTFSLTRTYVRNVFKGFSKVAQGLISLGQFVECELKVRIGWICWAKFRVKIGIIDLFFDFPFVYIITGSSFCKFLYFL